MSEIANVDAVEFSHVLIRDILVTYCNWTSQNLDKTNYVPKNQEIENTCQQINESAET